MKSFSKIRKELLLLVLPVALTVALALHFQKLTAVSGRLVGSWEYNDSLSGASLTTFKANSEWEAVCFDGPGHVASTVFKGRYADSGNTFRTYDIKSYIRKGSVDIWVEPCDKGNG